MAKKIDYASLYTLRSDGRYQGYWRDADGKRHTICDRDPMRLYERIQEKEAPKKKTFGQIADEWYDVHSAEVSWKASESYKPCLNRIKAHFGEDDISDVSAAEMQAFLRNLGAKNYSRRTVQMHKDVLSMIFDYAIYDKQIDVNPCSAVSVPRNLPCKKRLPPDDDAILAIRANTDAPFALFAQICLYAGLRRGEALALRYEDIDFKHGFINVERSVEFIGNNPNIKPPKTEAGTRQVVLPKVLRNQLDKGGTGYIFCQEDGKPLTKMRYRKLWDKYCDAIGYKITAHQLRHAYATMLFDAGVSDKDAQDQLGHANISVTRDIYTHIRKSRREETRKKIDQQLC